MYITLQLYWVAPVNFIGLRPVTAWLFIPDCH